MQIFYETLSRMAVLFSFIIIGFIVSKLGAVDSSAAGMLGKLENNIFIPALVLGTFMNNFTTKDLGPAWKLFVVSAVITVVMAVVAVFTSRVLSKDNFVRNMFTYGLAFSNFGFMGNAVVENIFPDVFDKYLIFTLPLWILIYLWGVPYLLMPSDEKMTIGKRLKSFVNPMFISMLVGMAIGLSGLKMPEWTNAVVSDLGSCMSPVAMLLTGITLSRVDFKKILTQVNIYAVTLVRLVIIPAITLIVLFFIPKLPHSFTVCIVCSLSMPLGLNTIVVPSAYGKDTSVAAGMAIISHLLSCITIPVVFYLMQTLI